MAVTIKSLPHREQLMHPNWQRKRLEIMQRDSFRCLACGESERTLHVHHKRYPKHGNLWDVCESDLQTLCEPCHSALGKHPRGGVFYASALELLNWWPDSPEYRGFVGILVQYEHCPICGENKDDSHSGCIGFTCCHSFDSPNIPGFDFECQTTTALGPAFVLGVVEPMTAASMASVGLLIHEKRYAPVPRLGF